MHASIMRTRLRLNNAHNAPFHAYSSRHLDDEARLAHTRTMALPPGAFAPIDPLGEALHFLRMSGIFYTRSEFTAPWDLALPKLEECLMFHVVTSGRC